MEVDYGPKKWKPVDPEKYPKGTFKHRGEDDSCSHFGGVCLVNIHQKNPEEDTCLTFCIPNRNDKAAMKKKGVENGEDS